MSTCKTCSGKTYEIKKKVNLSISVDWSTTNISNIPYVRKKNQLTFWHKNWVPKKITT